MRDRVHLWLLRLYQRLPTWGRRRVVRVVAPTFSVGAMCFIERGDGALLLVRHAYRRHWGVPGGLLKGGEEADDGARREVFEEVGLAIELQGEPTVQVDADPRRVDLIYRARPVDPADADGAEPRSPEIVEVAWFEPGALPALQHETATALTRLARVARDPVARPLPCV